MMEVDKDSNSNSDSSLMPKMSSFKDLRKPTMKETYQNLGTVIGKKEIQNVENIKEIILTKSPLPLFDECLRLIIIDNLRLEKEVVKILLSQNDQQIKRILACKWFFKALPKEFCTSEIFPYVSVSLRCKIITRLSKYLEDKNEAEEYFMFIRKNYDNQRADYLLPKCSGQFILKHFEKNKSILGHPAELRILSSICKRYPEVGLHILEHIFNLQNDSYKLKEYRQIVQYLAGNHHDLFVPFLKKCHSLLEPETFGRKVTKKLGRKVWRDFLSDVISTLPFKPKVLFSKLSFEEKVKFLAKLMRHSDIGGFSTHTWTHTKYELCKHLRLIKPEDRLSYIEGTFKQLYNLNFENNSKYWCKEMLALLPTETRKPFLLKMEKFYGQEESVFDSNMDEGFLMMHPEELIQLYDFSTAFEKLKEMLRTTPLPSRRKDIISHMVENCSINSDLEGLQEVIDYVVTRHRNDDCKILYNFIELIFHKFSWSALTSHSFEKLDELFNFCTIRSDPPWDVYLLWKERHIYHLLENGLDVDNQFKSYFENVLLKWPYATFLADYNCRHSKTLLMKLCQMAVQWIKGNASETSNDCLFRRMIEACARFSRTQGGSRIWKEVPGLEELLLEKLKSKYGELEPEQWPLDVWEKYYSDIVDAGCNPNCLLYVLVRNTDFVERHLEGIINCLTLIRGFRYIKMYKNCFNFVVKTASFYEKTERMKELLLREFKCGNSAEKREMALVLYSQMSTIEEFSEAVEEYLPKHERIEAQSDVSFSKIQLLIPALIRNVRPRWRNFDLILKFFMGDFLKRIRPSLHACSHYTRVDVVVPFLKRHFDALPQKVSYQKDILRLIAELSTRDETLHFCLTFWKKHNHYTIRSILFHFVSKLFVEQPIRDSFEVLKTCVLESDPVVITKMPKLEMVPDEFLEEYVDALMRFSEGQLAGFRNDFQRSILSHFHGKRIKVMSPDFSERIIRNHLFNPASKLYVERFATFYLLEGPNFLESRARMVFDVINGKKPSPLEVISFLETVMERSMADLIAFGNLFKAVLDNWPEYSLGILYEERVIFTYCDLYQKACRGSLDPELAAVEFAKELRELYASVDDLRDVVIIFGEALRKFLGNFEAAKSVSMIRELVGGSRDRNVAIVGIWALPKKAVLWFRAEEDPFNELVTKQKKMVDELFKVFESYDDTVVEIFLRRKFYSRN